MAKILDKLAKKSSKKAPVAKKSSSIAKKFEGFEYQVVRRPRVTEKATRAAEMHAYVFQVSPRATKHHIKTAVEHLFGVRVVGVRVMNVKGKPKRRARAIGYTKDWKKAYVTLNPADKIDVFSS